VAKLIKGNSAPSFQTTDIAGNNWTLEQLKGQKTLLSFYRYASCPLCNLRVNDLIARQQDWKDRGLTMIAFFQSDTGSILKYVGKQDSPFPIIPDPDRIIYKKYGVHGNLGKFLVGTVLQPGKLLKAAKKGFLPGKMENDITMVPADFLINEDGVIHTAYYGKDASDHLDVSVIESFLNNSRTE